MGRPVSYRTDIYTAGHWLDRGMRYATQAEALDYGRNETRVTHAPYRVVETEEPANYRYENGKLTYLKPLSFEGEIKKMWARILTNGTP